MYLITQLSFLHLVDGIKHSIDFHFLPPVTLSNYCTNLLIYPYMILFV